LQRQFSTAADTVTNAYRSLLLREPERAGLDFWSNKIVSGALHASDVAKSLVHSEEFSKLQNNATLPVVDTIWEDQASWDSITAAQLARLIAYNPSGDGVTYPNQDLHFIVSGYGPNSTATLSSDSHTYIYTDPNTQKEVNVSLPQTIYMNKTPGSPSAADFTYLANFIKAISDEVSVLTKEAVKWATQDPNSTGSVGYHPDTTAYGYETDSAGNIIARYLSYSHDWAGFKLPDGTTFAQATDLPNAYKAFVDYTNYLNAGLKSSGLKGLNQLVFETEGTYPDMPNPANDPNLYRPGGAYPNGYVKPPANWEASLFSQILAYTNTNPAWNSADGIKLAGTGETITNWGPIGWKADQWLAQVYDLWTAAKKPSFDTEDDDYPFTIWNTPSSIDPSSNSAAAVASDFANFFANTTLTVPGALPSQLPTDQLWNTRYMLSDLKDQSNLASFTNYNPDATYVFSYGPGGFKNNTATQNQPIFQYGKYILSNDGTHSLVPNSDVNSPQIAAYTWNAADFANFVSNFSNDLSANLNKITNGTFPTSATPSIGVWGGERALDAWFGYVDLSQSKSLAWRSHVQSISAGNKIGLAQYIDDAYLALVGRIPTTAEMDKLISVATSTLNPATQDKVTLTSQAAIINYLTKSSALDYKSLTDAQFIEHLYSDILGRASENLGAQYHTSLLQNGVSRSKVAQNFINSKEFITTTGYNNETATFASYVNFLWQDDPQSWTSTTPPTVGGPLSPQTMAISQLKTLMGANPNFTLVLDFDPQYSSAVTSGGAWNTTNLVSFLKGLNAAGLTPNVIFHPDAVAPPSGTPSGWFPNNGLTGDAINAMASWMATLNKAILDAGLPNSSLLSGMLGEGNLLPKQGDTYTTFKQDYQAAANKLGLPSQNLALWYTADWGADNTFSSNPSPVTGVFVQLYDYWTGNPLANTYKPDPANATMIGSQLLTTLLNAPAGQHSLNPQLLQNPSGTVFTLNFSGSPTGNTSDAPIFGRGTGVSAPWDLAATNQLLTALSNEAHTLYQANNNPTAIPQIAIWSAEDALNDLVQVVGSNATTVVLPA
jgi:hypothetical protein